MADKITTERRYFIRFQHRPRVFNKTKGRWEASGYSTYPLTFYSEEAAFDFMRTNMADRLFAGMPRKTSAAVESKMFPRRYRPQDLKVNRS